MPAQCVRKQIRRYVITRKHLVPEFYSTRRRRARVLEGVRPFLAAQRKLSGDGSQETCKNRTARAVTLKIESQN